jgi:hypothetical protein
MKAKQFYNSIHGLECVATCVSCSIPEWDAFMNGTKKASYREIHKLIKNLRPDFNWLTYKNPYKCQYRKKDGLIVVVHSAIEYFFQTY